MGHLVPQCAFNVCYLDMPCVAGIAKYKLVKEEAPIPHMTLCPT